LIDAKLTKLTKLTELTSCCYCLPGIAANVRPYPEGGIPINVAERYQVVCDFRPLARRCAAKVYQVVCIFMPQQEVAWQRDIRLEVTGEYHLVHVP
jgi:hypothetical protein